jgi:ankyrin repeat protein
VQAAEPMFRRACQDASGNASHTIALGLAIVSAAHGAAAAGDLPVLRYLVSNGANINALDRSGDSPLEVAVSANRVEVVKGIDTEDDLRKVGLVFQRPVGESSVAFPAQGDQISLNSTTELASRVPLRRLGDNG